MIDSFQALIQKILDTQIVPTLLELMICEDEPQF